MPKYRNIVINKCHGGFSLSEAALEYLGIPFENSYAFRSEHRDDPKLVAAVRTLGAKANGRLADLKIVKIPADVDWTIMEYDGLEWIAEKHRTWS